MKYIFFFFSFLLVNISFSQSVKFLNKSELSKVDLGKYLIVNLSSTSVSWELDEPIQIFCDFSLSDLPPSGSKILVKVNGKSFHSDEFQPFIVDSRKLPIVLEVKSDKKRFKTEFVIKQKVVKPYFSEDIFVFGLLAIVLAFVFYTSSLQGKFWKRLYTFLPALLLCYLIPAIFNSFGLISEEYSSLYNTAKDYLLPAALVLMTLGIDFKGLVNLGPKALIMFLTATVGIIIGGPIAILIFSYIDPSVIGGEGFDATWRGFSTLAGSWIGGGANQAAMLETYKYNPDLYGKMVTIDIVVANLWMAFLLWAAARAHKFDKWLKADTSSIELLKQKTQDYQSSIGRIASLKDYMVILGIAFGVVSISHFFGIDIATFFEKSLGKQSPFASSFFWLVVLATTGGLLLSLTKLRSYEGAGASKIGSVFIYILVVTIGMKMGLEEAIKEPMLILVGIVWMLIHASLLFIVAKIIKAPFFFIAVGSKANVGGAASAPVVAAAFHPSLAPVGALLAVLGYALGTYGAILSAELMRVVAPI